jgi:UDP-perosamine 4-acetyltransferase
VTATVYNVLIVGGGGHSKVVIEIFRSTGHEPAGILDPHTKERHVLGVTVMGGDDKAEELFESGYRYAHVAIGENALRRRIGDRLKHIGFTLMNALHPSAVISPSAEIGDGVAVMANAVINAKARVADFVIVNTGAIVEHDCSVGIATHVAPRSVMGGNVVLDDGVLFGIGAVARPLSRIGARAVVGAGAVVIGVIEADAIVAGSPARLLKR